MRFLFLSSFPMRSLGWRLCARAWSGFAAFCARSGALLSRYTRLCRVIRAYAALRALMSRYARLCRVARGNAALRAPNSL
jgi:hypothetical protein